MEARHLCRRLHIHLILKLVAACYILLILLLVKMLFLIKAVIFSLSKISVRACDTSMASAERPEGEAFVSGQEFEAAEALPA